MKKMASLLLAVMFGAVLVLAGCNKMTPDIGQPEESYVQQTVKKELVRYTDSHLVTQGKPRYGEFKFSDYYVGQQVERTDKNGIRQLVKKVTIACKVPFSLHFRGSVGMGPSTSNYESIINAQFLYWLDEKGGYTIEWLDDSKVDINLLSRANNGTSAKKITPQTIDRPWGTD